MRPRRFVTRPPSRRLHVGRLVGGVSGLIGLLLVPVAYFQLISRDPRTIGLPLFLLVLVFFPCIFALVGFLAGTLGTALVDFFKTPKRPSHRS